MKQRKPKCESACYSFQKKKKKKKLGMAYWGGEQENTAECICVLCRQHGEPLIIRVFILLLKSVNAEYTQSSTQGRQAERFGVRDPKIKWVIKLPLWLCVPAQLWLIFAKENKVVYFICMLKDALFLSPLSPCTIIISNVKCYLGIHNLFLCGEDTIDTRAMLCQAPDFFFF